MKCKVLAFVSPTFFFHLLMMLWNYFISCADQEGPDPHPGKSRAALGFFRNTGTDPSREVSL